MQSNDQVIAAADVVVPEPMPIGGDVAVLDPALIRADAAALDPSPISADAGVAEPTPIDVCNPQPLANPLVTESQVESHRALVCGSYDRCLDFAVRNGWRGWTCRICPQFEVERTAQLERLRELTDALPSRAA